MIELFALLALVVAVGGILVRWRLRRMRRTPEVTDDVLREIEEEGRVETSEPEPLDLDEVQAREEEFWAQSWDEPEPWRR